MKLTRSQSPLILGVVLLSLAVLPTSISAQTDAAERGRRHIYDVTITNLTQGQIFSPPIVYSHRGRFALFTPGQPAIPELAGLAEDAAGEDLLALLGADPWVADVAIGDNVVLPGESMTVRVESPWGFRTISALGMLVTTNDAFFSGSTSVSFAGKTIYTQAWDAGSEANTQDCDHIPGPPCGSGGVRVEDGAEGYVYTHAGIQDRGSLDPAVHDWRNPVAKIEIKRSYN